MDPLAYLILGGLLGMLGQGARAAIGLKGMADDAKALDLSPKDLFETARLVTSIVIGFLVGMAAALAYAIGHGGIPDLLKDFGSYYQILIGFIAAGYAGTDFLEGFISQYLPSGTTGTAADKIKAQQAAQTAQTTQAVQGALSNLLSATSTKTTLTYTYDEAEKIVLAAFAALGKTSGVSDSLSLSGPPLNLNSTEDLLGLELQVNKQILIRENGNTDHLISSTEIKSWKKVLDVVKSVENAP